MLAIKGVSRRFGGKAAVADVNLEIAPGAFIGVIGRSGAGKSTLLRMLNRLVDPSKGTISCDGVDVTALRGQALRDWRARCAMIFQQFNLIGRLDVLTNVLMGRLNKVSTASAVLQLWGLEDKAMALAALEQFDIANLAGQRADSLSGGQQQRVAIARALVQEPSIILAVNRTMNALERAFLIRSCTDSVFSTRTRPCLLHQIKRCSAPCTGEVSIEDYAGLVSEARAFLTGKSKAIKEAMAHEMEQAAGTLEFERAARYRDRLAALSAIQSTQGINPRSIEEADVFAIHEQAGQFCIEVFFFRTGQNWGNRAYFPKADRTLSEAEVLDAFLGQFYDDKPAPRLVLLSHEVEGGEILQQALSLRVGHRIEIATPKRGEKRDLVEHALTNAREALGRRLAESSSQLKLLEGVAEAFSLEEAPRRIEVYDNSHIMGTNAVGGMVVAGREGFAKTHYRKFNIKSTEITPGDDYGMMREVLQRRFSRLIKETPKDDIAEPKEGPEPDDVAMPSWPDLVLIDGGAGQMQVAREVFADLGLEDVALVGVAKGVDRDAGRETFIVEGKSPFKLAPRDPVLYFVQRLRDEAHRFAIGAHRQKRSKSMKEGGLQEIGGIGPQRKRSLLRHFGTLKAIERASMADLEGCPGIDQATARKVYDFFHEKAS